MSDYTPEQIEQAKQEAQLLVDIYGSAHGQIFFCTDDGKKHDIGAIVKTILAALEAAERELKEYESLIALQHTRTIKADKLWQKAHSPQKHTYPDLGQLIDWLLDEISGWRNRAVMAEEGFANAVQASDTQTKRIKQLLDERDALVAYAAKLEKAGDDMRESSDGSILHCDAIRDWDAARKEKPGA